jgi:uncharacterized membrane protein YgdD (TMEM256/DUF423 family)
MNSKPVTAWRWLAVAGAIYGFSAVTLAALGAHAIPFEDFNAMRLWDTAVEIHLVHAVAMLAIAAICIHSESTQVARTGFGLAIGTLFFSGSLYLRAAGFAVLPSQLAPAGGMILVASWAWLAFILIRKRSDRT